MSDSSLWRNASPEQRRYAAEAARQRSLVIQAGLQWLAGKISAIRYRRRVRAAMKELRALDARISAAPAQSARGSSQ